MNGDAGIRTAVLVAVVAVTLVYCLAPAGEYAFYRVRAWWHRRATRRRADRTRARVVRDTRTRLDAAVRSESARDALHVLRAQNARGEGR